MDHRDEVNLEKLVRRYTSHMAWRPRYTEWVEGRLWQELHQEPVIRTLRELLRDIHRMTVLEVGSGMGGLLVSLLREGARVVGVDVNFDYCRISRLRGHRYSIDVPVVQGVVERLPVADRSIDLLVAYEVFEHVFCPRSMLQEVARVLADEGVAIMTVPNRWTLYDHHYHLWGISLLPRSLADHIIRRVNREKAFGGAGVQSLSEMHYRSWFGLRRMVQEADLTMLDVRELRLNAGHYDRKLGALLGRGIGALKRLRLAGLAYRAYRASIQPNYHVVLIRSIAAERKRKEIEAQVGHARSV